MFETTNQYIYNTIYNIYPMKAGALSRLCGLTQGHRQTVERCAGGQGPWEIQR
jgi:hypothetical protein